MKYQVEENCLTIFLPSEVDHHNAEKTATEYFFHKTGTGSSNTTIHHIPALGHHYFCILIQDNTIHHALLDH